MSLPSIKQYTVNRWLESSSFTGPAIETWLVTGDTDDEAVADLKRQLRERLTRPGYSRGDVIVLKDETGVQVNAGCGRLGELAA